MNQKYSLTALVKYFLKLGTTGFGGPVALIGYMHTDLVEKRKWITNEDYKEGLALSQLAPGPLAAQLAIYLGYVDFKITGATLAGIAFVIPSFVMVVGLGYAYMLYNGLPWMHSMFYGVGAAVIGIMAVSSFKLTRKTVGKNLLLWIIFVVMMATTAITERENVWLILASGFVVWFHKSAPPVKHSCQYFLIHPCLLQISASISFDEKLISIWWFFLKAGTFVFGSGLAIVPFLYGSVVQENHWLTGQQFLDAVAVAMITPGPVVITVGFIGYLVAGFPGAYVAALATFLPCYLFTIIPAPYFKKYGKKPGIKAFVDGVTTAAIGAIAGAVIVLAKRQFTDMLSVLIAVITVLLLLRFKIPEPVIIIAAAITGLLIIK
ncbi:chromate transporter [Ginsengibacter hankyongi]|uniref:Chromate transporter n=1 Tax=Ginsengibacter hankyongi TaxID=2607284 RepID=A0A5J5IJ75_9BACT|nr:chromate transporter [Ginsengibacter hankyongi]KAA9040811.1 chromate transporter [Ginsengibacter hankyongi]